MSMICLYSIVISVMSLVSFEDFFVLFIIWRDIRPGTK